MPNSAMESAERACAAGECEDVIDLLERAVRSEPNNFKLHCKLGFCYSGGCRPHSLTHPEMGVQYLRQALRLLGSNARPARAAILDDLGNTLIHSRELTREAALREAIDCHSEAADIYASFGRSDDWARAHFNLGNSCCELAELTGEDHWQEAVSHYEQSLRFRTRERDPERYAALLENLGTAYRRLPAVEAGGNVKRSIACYRRALGIYTAGAYPDRNAALQNNIGNAFLSLPETNEITARRNARRALRHFERALRIQSRDTHSRAFGVTQYNRAQAYFRLARSSPAANLQTAFGCLTLARTAFQSCGEERYLQFTRAQLAGICRS
jgi:tetratricopeptide (TPR) repeat protein